MSDELLRTAGFLFEPSQVVEVRAIADEGIASGYFDDREKLASQAEVLDGTPGVQGIYVTLNQVNPALLARRSNRVKMRLGKKDVTTADSDILHRRWFPVDIDPARPSGVSSTDEEHEAARSRAEEISSWLGRECGWPAPILADSGNGAHLLYRIDLPNDDPARELVRRCLEVLLAMFGDQVADIDTTNHNAGRIWKLYGTVSRKGDNTPDRPHRRSAILDVPSPVVPVSRELLEQLAGALPESPPEPRARGKPIDLAGWLRDHGIGVVREKPYQGGTLYVLDECPFSGAHRDGAFAIQFGNGAVHAGCQHASCNGGKQRWPELRERFEPKAGRTTAKSKTPEKGSQVPAPQALDDLPGRAEALEVMQHGDPKQVMMKTFLQDHEGDDVVAECLILSFASRSVENTHGLHVSVTGESGKGKSHAFTTMLEQIPERLRLANRMSSKAIFYLENLQPGSVIVIDDREIPDDLAEILKGVTTSFRKPFRYQTVSTDRKGITCTIPERCVWWVAKVEGAGDDQVFNRMLTCWIDESAEQDERCVARSLDRDADIPVDHGAESPEVLICRALWEDIGSQRFHVMIPFARLIRFRSYANRRNPEMLLDLIKANAVLRSRQREQFLSGQIPCLIATREDFEDAARLFEMLNGTAGGQETKLTRKESDLLDTIRKSDWAEFTIPQLQKATGLSNNVVHRIIHGHSSHGKTYSGLLEKCPAIAYTDRTVMSVDEDNGTTLRRRTNAYTFDRKLYRKWSSGGSVWLDGGDNAAGPAGSGSITDCPTTSRKSHSNPTENSVRPENDPAGTDCVEASLSHHASLGKSISHGRSGNTQDPDDTHSPVHVCACDPESSAGQGPAISHSSQNGQTGNRDENDGNLISRNYCGTPADLPWDCGEGPLPRVKASDYKVLDVPEPSSCHVCGTRWSHYAEKLTDERRRRPKDQQMAWRICKACYQAAKEATQKAAVVLPGTFDVSRLERVKVSVGRCSVCDLESAVYFDRRSDVRLCESCYRRVSHVTDHGEVVG